MTSTTSRPISDDQRRPRPRGRRVPGREPVYADISDFLIDEAALLDDDLFDDWLDLVADDIRYQMPARLTRYRKDGRGFDDRGAYFDDDRLALGLRVQRNGSIASAWDRDPAPRVRRLVTNVVVHETDPADEFAVQSSILLLRSRFDAPEFDLLTARREDVLRRGGHGFLLARRVVLVDQSSLGAAFLSVLL